MRNNRAAAPLSDFRGSAMAAFDRLPPELRRALHEAVIKWDPRETRRDLNRRLKYGETYAAAIAAEVAEIRSADEREVRAFAFHWPSRFGRYPHIAAAATILRYHERALPPDAP